MEKIKQNHLKYEKSLYLKRHEGNPIEWWPYGEEALELAKKLNKPIFLSIGYSSCHWCHAMSEESFENPEVAAFLNEHFINIKVDREEYPDIDDFYQKACHFFSGKGGWPLSAFTLPDLKPYFVGTYFPPVAKQQTPSFMDVIKELARAYQDNNEQVKENANKVVKAIEEGVQQQEKVIFEGHFPHPQAVMNAIKQFQDNENGHYGTNPKFPNYAFLEWAVEQMNEGMIQEEAGHHIIKSIENMLMGGIFDHARGGVHRYSTSADWKIPHFEKMLYDQAGLLKVLAKFSLIYPSPLVFDAIISTLEYLESEMLSEDLFFFSAQDADSEGQEGAYFTFTEGEFVEALQETEDTELLEGLPEFTKWFGITKDGNFEHQLNVLSLSPQYKDQYYTPENWTKIRKVRQTLLNSRRQRIPPATDTKGIASWNFLLISSLVDLVQHCKVDVIRQRAGDLLNKVANKVSAQFQVAPSQLRHSNTQESSILYLEDIVFYLEATLRLYEISGEGPLKEQLSESIDFVLKEFHKDGQLQTRAFSNEESVSYPNLKAEMFDQSFRSPVSAFISLVRRASVLLGDTDMLDAVKDLKDNLIQATLKHPLNCGEGLRALTYPDQAYRVVHIPFKWSHDPRFIEIMAHLGPRFIIDYKNKDNGDVEESWEICNISECELKGTSLEEFLQTLIPPTPSETETNSEKNS